MSDDEQSTKQGSGAEGEDAPPEKKFFVDRAKTGRSTCKKCKQKLPANELRIAKAGYNPFGAGMMKQWHHVACMFEVFSRQRPTTARIRQPDDMDGWSDLEVEDREEILKLLPNCPPGDWTKPKDKSKDPPKAAKSPKTPKSTKKKEETEAKKIDLSRGVLGHKDNSFREFRRLCAQMAEASSYLAKTAIFRELITKGTDGGGFKGDLRLWCRLLLPGHVKRVYNLQSKQLVKLFSSVFQADQDDMLEDLEKGDVAETVREFFEKSSHCQPAKKSKLSIQDVDKFLEELSNLTKEEEQIHQLKKIAKLCTSNDLKMIVRLVKHDLRINAGPKHILEAVHSDAYAAFQTSHDIDAVLTQASTTSSSGVSAPSSKSSLTISVGLMTPVLPMLAAACKSVEQAMKKCPNGMYSEIKYDGERVQLHKRGDEFKYFSRSLKPVVPYKVVHFKDYIPQAFPHGKDLILDAEVLLVDTHSGKPLPFGSLGKHKKTEFKDATVCLFVFDCLYFNGEVLTNKPIRKRRQILLQNMTEIKNHVMFSETEKVHEPKDLEAMITKVFRLGLEGLVLKDLESIYEPGKRHWLKVKKDYLFGGAMADSADLVVLGAWFGTGNKGGMKSVFLMGCYDPFKKRWYTVTKVHTGHDDKTLERLQDELDMIKISKEASKVPDWLKCTKTMIPDFVARDPKAMPVWEITGAEFTQHEVHTADGISIRFPRVSRVRDDKTWETATTLSELKTLYKTSKENGNFTLFSKTDGGGSASSKQTEKNSEDEDMAQPDNTSKTGSSKSQDSSRLNPPKHTKRNKDNQESKHHSSNDGDEKHSKRKHQINETKNAGSDDEDKPVSKKNTHDADKRSVDSSSSNVSSNSSYSEKRKGTLSKTKRSRTKAETKVKRQKSQVEDSSSEEENCAKSSKLSKKTRTQMETSSIEGSSDKESQAGRIKRDLSKKKAAGTEKRKKNKKPNKTTRAESESGSEHSSQNSTKKRKNEEYSSDSDTDSMEDAPPKLPDVFAGARVVLPNWLPGRDDLGRLFVVYGGDVVGPLEHAQPTHVLHAEWKVESSFLRKWPPEARHVHVEWLRRSVALGRQADCRRFAVSVAP